MITYKPGDVIIVPFPFSDKAAVKPRPALIISTEAFCTTHARVLTLMITTAQRTQWPSDVPLQHYAQCGLPIASVVRMKFFTVEIALIKDRIGHAHPQDWKRAMQRLRAVVAK